MKRKLIALIYVMIMLTILFLDAYASDKKEHRRQLESVIFGRDNYSAALPKPQRDAIEALACAAYLCLDQFNDYGQVELSFLKEFGVPNLPASISDIDFHCNSHHRRYTHRGLNPDPLLEPPSEKGKWKQKW